MPLTMEAIRDSVTATSQQAAELLRDSWIPECCDIVDDNREAIESWMPPGDDEVGGRYFIKADDNVSDR